MGGVGFYDFLFFPKSISAINPSGMRDMEISSRQSKSQRNSAYILVLEHRKSNVRFSELSAWFVIILFAGAETTHTMRSVSKNHYEELRGEARRSRTF